MTKSNNALTGLSDDEFVALAEGVDRISTDAVLSHSVADRLPEIGANPETAQAIATAFLYFEQNPSDLEECFGPMMSGPGWQMPPALPDLPADYFSLWEELAARVAAPLARARLHDLCFITKTGTRHTHARAATQAYLELARRYEGKRSPSEQRLLLGARAYDCVQRALTLAAAMNQRDLVEEAMAAGVELARVAVDDPEAGHGTVCHLLRPFIERDDCPPAVDAVLTAAQLRFGSDGWAANDLAGLQVKRVASPDERSTLRLQQVMNIVAMADAADKPINALAHLQDAEKMSARYGLTAINREIRVRLQNLRREDLGFTRRETRMSLDPEAVDTFLGELRSQVTWYHAIVAMISTVGPPTGNVVQNRAAVPELMKAAPLSTMIGHQTVGPDNAPLDETEGGDEEGVLRRIEVFQLQSRGFWHVLGLRAILEQWDDIDLDDAEACLSQSPHVEPAVARKIGECLGRHRNGDFDGATSILLPRIERMVRDALILVKEPVTRSGGAGSSRKNLTLSDLIDLLGKRGLDESWVRFLRAFLVGNLNFRNDALHGNVDEANEF
ncbi:MAG: DUF7380 domain-containing protein, partial [Acidimicrobiales bacterium]